MEEEPPWKKLKLSLERPYKDDSGHPLPELLDITPDGQHIYRPREDPTAVVGTKLRRIFLERGTDFFEAQNGSRVFPPPQTRDASTQAEDATDGEKRAESTHAMTPEELYKLRMSVLPQLYIAFGEMCQARDLLALLLTSSPPAPSTLPPAPLAAAIVDKPAPIQSVRAFDAQLTIGGKDRSLRAAADLFKSAAEKMEDSRLAGERYWLDALKIRRENWGLIPAPLPLGSATGKGADKTSKDFLISFGLEEAPPAFRRRAIGRIAAMDSANTEHPLEFPLRQRTRLRASLTRTRSDGSKETRHSRLTHLNDGSLDGALRAAQAEVVEQEIFSVLIKEASSLPNASAEVSERLIVLDAAQNTELRFELVDSDCMALQQSEDADPLCDLIFMSSHILLLRAHAALKTRRLQKTSISRTVVAAPAAQPPSLLQPIIDMLQYREFWERVRDEIGLVVSGLRAAGVSARVHYDPVADSGQALVAAIQSEKTSMVGGEVLVRIDDRHTLRFTTSSPSTLTAHLPQATLPIASISQLTQLLSDEISNRLLGRICEIGAERCDKVNGTWFVDLLGGRSVGRWECCVLDFRISFDGYMIACSVSRANRDGRASQVETYRPGGQLCLFEWVCHMIDTSLGR